MSIKSIFAATAVCNAILAVFPSQALAAEPATSRVATTPAQQVNALAERYYLAQAHFDPVSATINGDNRFDDELTMTIVPAVRARQLAMLHEVQSDLAHIDRSKLLGSDLTTYDVMAFEVNALLGLGPFKDYLLPLNQMDALPVTLANFASGQSSQPIATVAQYDAYLKRISGLPEWIDAAIDNMHIGMQSGTTQPKALMRALLPQIKAMAAATVDKSDFATPIRQFPTSFSAGDKARLTGAYLNEVQGKILPSIRKLAAFLENDYLPAARDTAGWVNLPNGVAWYRAWIQVQTTTTMSPDQIHAIGLAEMTGITGELAKLGPKLGYTGEPIGLIRWLQTQRQYRPFKTDGEVLDAYRTLNAKIVTHLPSLFATLPKAVLEIRPEPELTRDAASTHYSPGSADGTRPGVLWAVIIDPAKYDTTRMTSLFLHEGQPGHHFQLSRQLELDIPSFRKFSANNAYIEGWALYAETLGHEMGLYDDPSAHAGSLADDMMRAARLVVDTGLHAKGWTREQTIQFLVEKAGHSEEQARNFTERYMAWPGQALSYKIGALKIMELRQRAQAALGPKFSLARFHDAILSEGPLPLALLDTKMTAWIAEQAK